MIGRLFEWLWPSLRYFKIIGSEWGWYIKYTCKEGKWLQYCDELPFVSHVYYTEYYSVSHNDCYIYLITDEYDTDFFSHLSFFG